LTKRKKLTNGFILKSDFCKKNNISIKEFNETLLKLGFLRKNPYYGKIGQEFTVDLRLGISEKGGTFIKPLYGTHDQGTFKYKEIYLNDIFKKEQKQTPKIDFEIYKIKFGKYKGRLLSSMNSEEEKQYCEWAFKNWFNNLNKLDKSYDRDYLAFKWFLSNNIQ
jgi:hypothetical protein